jgi:hypothetical protein
MNKELKQLLEDYTKILQFGVGDLKDAIQTYEPTIWFKAIERHEKLAAGVHSAINAIDQITFLANAELKAK